MNARTGVGLIKQAGADFVSDDAMTLGAALAFYTVLSLAPLLVLLVWFASLLGGSTKDELIDQMVALVGEQGGEAIRSIVESAQDRPTIGSIAGMIGIATLVFSAAGVFAQLQHSLNVVFDVRSKPAKGAARGLWAWVRRRLLSMGMVISIGFLLLVSLVLSAAVAALLGSARSSLQGAEVLWASVGFIAPLLVFVALFALLFKFLPDVKIAWKDVAFASVVTAVLFAIGKELIGLYLGRSSIGSAYGAAGSLLVLLVWVYYSAVIFFLGAELSQVWATAHGRGFAPKEGVEVEDRPSEKAGAVSTSSSRRQHSPPAP